MEKFNYLLLKQIEQLFFYIAAFGITEWLIYNLKLSKTQQLLYYLAIGFIAILILLFSNTNIYHESF